MSDQPDFNLGETAAAQAARLLVIGVCEAGGMPLAEMLRAERRAIAVVTTGRQAISRLLTASVDLILSAAHLPDMSAAQLLDQIRDIETARETPALVCASARELADAERCLQRGATDILLVDVFSPAFIERKIIECLRHQETRSALRRCQAQYAAAQKLANDLTQIVLPVGVALSRIKNFDRLLEKILRETKTLCKADGGTLYLLKDDQLHFTIMLNDSLGIAFNSNEDAERLPESLLLRDPRTGLANHQHVATATALLGVSINIPDIYRVKEFDFSGAKRFDLVRNYRSISTLTVPLKDYHGDVFGVLQLINARDDAGQIISFTPYMQQATEALASLAALVLSTRLLLDRQKELFRLENELRIGREIQTSFLPSAPPALPGWDIAASLRPANEISGDFYDIFPMHDGQRLCFVIADVCDKGVGAALFMVLIRTLIRAFMRYTTDSVSSVRNVLDTANRYLVENHADSKMFATLFIGMLNVATGRLAYANCGHPAPVVLKAAGEEMLEPTGPVIGAFADSEFDVRQIALAPGDTVFAYTDGIPDAKDRLGNLLTKERLFDVLRRRSGKTAQALIHAVNLTVQQHTANAAQFDDATLIAIRRVSASQIIESV